MQNACCTMKITVRAPQRTRQVMVRALPHAQELSARVKGMMNMANMPAKSVAPRMSILKTFFRVEKPGFG